MRYYILIICISFSLLSNGQNGEQEALTELKNISKAYLQQDNLSFHTTYSFKGSNPGHSTENIFSKVVKKGQSFWSIIDSVEIVQNDKYYLVIYHQEKMIVLNDPMPAEQLLFRSRPDTMLQTKNILKTSLTSEGGNNSITIDYNDISKIKKCVVTYNKSSYLIKTIQIFITGVNQTGHNEYSGYGVIELHYSNYTNQLPPNTVFDTTKFIYMKNGEYSTTQDYQSYQLINYSSTKNASNYGK